MISPTSWLGCLAAFLSVATPVGATITLSDGENFDLITSPLGTPERTGMTVWTVGPAGAVAIRSPAHAHRGAGALSVAGADATNGQPRATVSRALTPPSPPGPYWVDFYAKPAGDPAPLLGAPPLIPQLTVAGMALTFTLDEPPTTGTTRRMLISHVSTTGTTTPLGKMELRYGRLIDTNPSPTITSYNLTPTWYNTSKNWHRFTFRFGPNDCDFYFDGLLKATAIPLPSTTLSVLAIRGSPATNDAVMVDDLQVSSDSPLPDPIAADQHGLPYPFADADHDGLPDSWESLMGLGIAENSRVSILNGKTALAAYQAYSSRNPPGTPLNKIDTDGDGMPDAYENSYPAFLNFLDPTDAAPDFDGDGKTNLEESKIGTTPISPPLYTTEAIPFPSTGLPVDQTQVNMNLLASSPDGHAVVEARYRGKFLGDFIFDPATRKSEWLDLPEVPWVSIAGVNNAGQVIGSHPDGYFGKAFLTKARPGDGATALTYPITPLANPLWTTLYSINSAGEVLGSCYQHSTYQFVYFLYKSQLATPTSVVLNLGQAYLSCQKLSDSGDLAPNRLVGNNYRLGRFHARSQTFAALPPLSGSTPVATECNQVGDFLGMYVTATNTLATCLWKKANGAWLTLGGLNSAYGCPFPISINNLGSIVGCVPLGDGSYQACVWPASEGGPPTPTLLGLPGASCSSAAFINNNAFPIILGTSYIQGQAQQFISRFGTTLPLLDCAARRASISLEHVQRLTDSGCILVSGHSESARCIYYLTPTPDTDGDGFSDDWERIYNSNRVHFDPYSVQDGNANSEDLVGVEYWNGVPASTYNTGENSHTPPPGVTVTRVYDTDSLNDHQEFLFGTDPESKDTDGDSMDDGWEVFYHLNPLNSADGYEDPDNDEVTNSDEFANHTNPQGGLIGDPAAYGITADWIEPYDINENGTVLAQSVSWSTGDYSEGTWLWNNTPGGLVNLLDQYREGYGGEMMLSFSPSFLDPLADCVVGTLNVVDTLEWNYYSQPVYLSPTEGGISDLQRGTNTWPVATSINHDGSSRILVSKWDTSHPQAFRDYFFAKVAHGNGNLVQWEPHIYIPLSAFAGSFSATDVADDRFIGNVELGWNATQGSLSAPYYSSDAGATWRLVQFPEFPSLRLTKCQKGNGGGCLGHYVKSDGTTGNLFIPHPQPLYITGVLTLTSVDITPNVGTAYCVQEVAMAANGDVLWNSNDWETGPMLTRNGVTTRLANLRLVPEGWTIVSAVAMNAKGQILLSVVDAVGQGTFLRINLTNDLNQNGIPDEWELAHIRYRAQIVTPEGEVEFRILPATSVTQLVNDEMDPRLYVQNSAGDWVPVNDDQVSDAYGERPAIHKVAAHAPSSIRMETASQRLIDPTNNAPPTNGFEKPIELRAWLSKTEMWQDAYQESASGSEDNPCTLSTDDVSADYNRSNSVMNSFTKQWKSTYDNLQESTEIKWRKESSEEGTQDYFGEATDLSGNTDSYTESSSWSASDYYTDQDNIDDNPQIGSSHITESASYWTVDRSEDYPWYRWPRPPSTDNGGEDNQDWDDQDLEASPSPTLAASAHSKRPRSTRHAPAPSILAAPSSDDGTGTESSTLSSYRYDNSGSITDDFCYRAAHVDREGSSSYHHEINYSDPLNTGDVLQMLKSANVPYGSGGPAPASQLYFSPRQLSSDSWAVDLGGYINAARTKFRWTRQGGDIHSPETKTWTEVFWPETFATASHAITGFETSPPMTRQFSYTFHPGESISPYFTQDPWDGYFSKGPSMLVQASPGTPSGYGKLGPLELEVTSAWSDQLLGVRANWMPDGTGLNNKAYIIMGCRADGKAYAKVDLKVPVPPDSRAKILWRLFRATGSAEYLKGNGSFDADNIAEAQGSSTYEPNGQIVSVVLDSPVNEDNKNYVLVYGYDIDGDGSLSKQEAHVPLCWHDPPGKTTPSQWLPFTFVPISPTRYNDSKATVQGYLGVLSNFVAPEGSRLLSAFLSNTVPTNAVSHDAVIKRLEPGLTHPVGVIFLPASEPGTSNRYSFDDSKPLAEAAAKSSALWRLLVEEFKKHIKEVQDALQDSDHNFVDFHWGLQVGINFDKFQDTDLFFAIAHGVCDLDLFVTVDRSLTTSDIKLTGSIKDIYDFDYDFPVINLGVKSYEVSKAAEVQAGFNSLGVGGRVFKTSCDYDQFDIGDQDHVWVFYNE